jgi:hypothetical protein
MLHVRISGFAFGTTSWLLLVSFLYIARLALSETLVSSLVD